MQFPEGLATAAVRVFSPLMSGLSTPPTMVSTTQAFAYSGPLGWFIEVLRLDLAC